jgi:hypothetical protein
VSLAMTATVAAACGAGWLALGWLVMRESFGDAAGEALGVVFGVLIVVSVIGAIRAYRAVNSGEDSEKPS